MQILVQCGLIAFGKQHIVPLSPPHPQAKCLLCVQRIGTDDTPFDALRSQKLLDTAEFVLLVSDDLLLEDDTCLCARTN